MMYANGTRVIWTSNAGRVRHAVVKTQLVVTGLYIVRVSDGTYAGRHFVLPDRRLTVKTA